MSCYIIAPHGNSKSAFDISGTKVRIFPHCLKGQLYQIIWLLLRQEVTKAKWLVYLFNERVMGGVRCVGRVRRCNWPTIHLSTCLLVNSSTIIQLFAAFFGNKAEKNYFCKLNAQNHS